MSASSATSSDNDFVCLYLDDFCEEVEVDGRVPVQSGSKRGRDTQQGVGVTMGSSKRKRKMLNKEEKAQVMLSICDVNVDEVLSYVKETVSNEKHITENSTRRDFWGRLKSSDMEMMTELLRTLVSTFSSLYKSCDKGKDKYMKFQIEWHQCCSVFLLPLDKSLSDIGVSVQKFTNLGRIQQRWVGYCEGRSVDKGVRDAVMIAVCSAVYDYLLKRVSKVQQSILNPTASICPVPQDTDSVYYRFCGATIASMLHARYNKCRVCKQEQREVLDMEIQVLKCIHSTDKSHIPEELKYRDRGFMYFPSQEFLSFLRGVDNCVMENANDSTFEKYGPEMIDVVVKQLEATQEFQQQFKTLVTSFLVQKNPVADMSKFDPTIKLVYKELSRKLCHTRLGEFIDAKQQKLAASKGKSTLAGQNLRDELLTSHVKLKSMIN